jgi:hypothetical protein
MEPKNDKVLCFTGLHRRPQTVLELALVPLEGIEPPTLALRKPCSTAELQRHTA